MTAEPTPDLEHVHDFEPDGRCPCGAELVDGGIAHPASGLGEASPIDPEGTNAYSPGPTPTERLEASRDELVEHAVELHTAGETEAAGLADRGAAAATTALEAGVVEDASVATGPEVDVGPDHDALFRAQGYLVMQSAVKNAALQAGQLAPDTIRAVIDATFKAVAQAKLAGDRQAEVGLTTDLAAFRALLRFRMELTKVDEAQQARARLLGTDGPPMGPQNGQVPPGLPR